MKILFVILLSTIMFLNVFANDSVLTDVEKKIQESAVKASLSTAEVFQKKIDEKNGLIVKNKIVIKKDISFLYDSVIGRDYIFKDKLCKTGTTNYRLKINSGFFKDDLKCSNVISNKAEDFGSFENIDNMKMLAIERSLFGYDENIISSVLIINSKIADEKDMEKRVNRVYEKLNYHNWSSDRIRFIVNLSYIDKLEQTVPSLGIMVFPAYTKYIPGNFSIIRRYAPYLTIGDSSKVDSNIYTVGINIEIQDGFGVNIGYSTYDINDSNKDSLTYGIILSSDLWNKFF